MIDRYAIEMFQKFLKLAETQGTDAIKIVAGDAPNTYVVEIIFKKIKQKENKNVSRS